MGVRFQKGLTHVSQVERLGMDRLKAESLSQTGQTGWFEVALQYQVDHMAWHGRTKRIGQGRGPPDAPVAPAAVTTCVHRCTHRRHTAIRLTRTHTRTISPRETGQSTINHPPWRRDTDVGDWLWTANVSVDALLTLREQPSRDSPHHAYSSKLYYKYSYQVLNTGSS